MPSATKLDTDMSHWGGGVTHYRLEDGTHIAISVDTGPAERAQALVAETLGEIGGSIHTYDTEPTVILPCDENGVATSLDRLHEFPPGTTHAEALEQLAIKLEKVNP